MKLALICDSLGVNGAGFSRYEKIFIQYFLNKFGNSQLFVFLPEPGLKSQFQNYDKAMWIKFPKSAKRYFKKVSIIKHYHRIHSFECIHYMENIFWYKPNGVKSILTLHDISPLLLVEMNLMNWPMRFWYKFMIKKALRDCDKVITDSEASKKDIGEVFNLKKEAVQVVYNAIPLRDFKYHEVKEVTNKKFILVPCTYQKRKNLINMVKAFEKFCAGRNNDAFLVITGQVDYINNSVYEEVKLMKESLASGERILLLNGVSDQQMNWLYKQALLTFYVTYYEAFGYTIVESLVQGTPVLAGVRGSQKEIGRDYAYYCHPADINGMADNLTRMIDAPKLVVQEEIHEYLRRQFSPEVFFEKILEIYASC